MPKLSIEFLMASNYEFFKDPHCDKILKGYERAACNFFKELSLNILVNMKVENL